MSDVREQRRLERRRKSVAEVGLVKVKAESGEEATSGKMNKTRKEKVKSVISVGMATSKQQIAQTEEQSWSYDPDSSDHLAQLGKEGADHHLRCRQEDGNDNISLGLRAAQVSLQTGLVQGTGCSAFCQDRAYCRSRPNSWPQELAEGRKLNMVKARLPCLALTGPHWWSSCKGFQVTLQPTTMPLCHNVGHFH